MDRVIYGFLSRIFNFFFYFRSAKFQIQFASSSMHTYTLRVGMVGLNDKKSVAHVKKVFHEALQEDFDNSGKILKQRMTVKLEKILGSADKQFQL